MSEKRLLDFITEARKKGFSDTAIRNSLFEYGWSQSVVEKAFQDLNPKFKIKNQVCIFLSDELLGDLEKRAKKNLFTVSEQIEDILRRSCVSVKKSTNYENIKVDDKIVHIISREKRKSKKKAKKK